MGFNIFAFPERLVDGRYAGDVDERVFDWRQYEMFAFLGGFASKAGIPAIAAERGIPPDGLRFEPFDDELRAALDGASWLSVQELLDFDYDATFVGTFRIVADRGDDDFTYEYDSEAGTEITFRRFLGPSFFDELARLAASGAERIVFFYG